MKDSVERRDDDVVDLGIASVETKGPGILTGDEFGQQHVAGLSDD